MRLLLDTQIMLWWLLEDARLGPQTRELMALQHPPPSATRASLLGQCFCLS